MKNQYELSEKSEISLKRRLEIEHIASQFAMKYFNEVDGTDRSPSIRDFYESVLYPDTEVDFVDNFRMQNCNYGPRIVGLTLPKRRIIALSNELEQGSNEYAFTFAHEFGHAVLHSSIESTIDCVDDPTVNRQKIEIEADFFAFHLLMPGPHVWRIVRKVKMLDVDQQSPRSVFAHLQSHFFGMDFAFISARFNLMHLMRQELSDSKHSGLSRLSQVAVA